MARAEPNPPGQKPRPGFAAGSEGWDGTEDPSRPVASSDERIAREPSRSVSSEGAGSTQSEHALSEPGAEPADDGRFSVAEEVSLDMASDQARRVGAPPAVGTEADAEEGGPPSSQTEAFRKAMERNVPPSE